MTVMTTDLWLSMNRKDHMKQALALVLASGTFGLTTGAEAGVAPPAAHPFVFEEATVDATPRPLLVDDEGEGGNWFWSNGGGSDDRDDGGSDDGNGGGSGSDDCNPDDPVCAAGNAAPAGTVAPPKNGLFTDGTAPVVKSN